MRRQVKWVWVWGGVMLGLMLGVIDAAAHAITPLRTSPENRTILSQSPPEIILWFAEELISPTSTLLVFNAKGEQVTPIRGGVDLNDPDHASLRLALPPLPKGVYVVQWLVMLVDGDISEGSFVFAIGKNITPADLDQVSAPAGKAGSSSVMVGGSVIFVIAIGGLIRLTRVWHLTIRPLANRVNKKIVATHFTHY